MSKKYVYFFGQGKADGNTTMKDLLGGKGANLAEMTNAGVPVPPGFTITTEVCTAFYENNGQVPVDVDKEMLVELAKLEKAYGAKLGDAENPLLVSVRSGAKFSMPGMMDTVLNLGLNDETVQGLIKKTNNARFSYDAYRRFIQMFANVVMELDKSILEKMLHELKEKKGVELDTELSAEDLKDLVIAFKKKVKELTGKDFPLDSLEQLKMSRDAVFKSWNNKRAIFYRRANNIPDDIGTAVNIQAMVFGNMGDNSGTGVGFTRNPSTGEKIFFGEYLINAQGEDVVAGIRTPEDISDLEKVMPAVYKELKDITTKLEQHYKDIQDFEFTIQEGKLYMLQTRNGKRTGSAAVKIAVAMVTEGLINEKEALMQIAPEQLDQLLHPSFDPKAKTEVIGQGLNASPGAAVGKIVFEADDAVEKVKNGEKVILVRNETCPDDIHGMDAAEGVLTGRGGATSHAVVVSRQMGKPCIAGVQEKAGIKIDEEAGTITGFPDKKDLVLKEGDVISIDGTTGNIMLGEVPTIIPDIRELGKGDYGKLMGWADKYRKIGVRTNADTPKDSKIARDNGAEGIGLCRTEHMFFEKDRLTIMQEMILASDEAGRRKALDKLLPMQKKDFIGIFEVMDGLPVTIRLLDPPLHEFLPKREELMVEVAVMKCKGKNDKELEEKEALLKRVEELHEFNPMLGLRGCRLGISMPEITEMQARAIIEAACEVKSKGIKASPEIMVPLVGTRQELANQKELINKVAKEVMDKCGTKVDYLVGTMIEIPRAAITADEIAQEAEFFSFGTNDLTQMAFGYSRDDAGRFIKYYLDNGILSNEPFQVLDQAGIGQLVEMGIKKGRATKKDLKIGICGEHGGEPSSVKFCHRVGMNYVSCSPYRVPIARLAAAQAALE